MKSNANFGLFVVLIAAVIGSVALIVTSASRGSPSKAEMREALERKLDSLVPEEAVVCGVVARGMSRTEAISCASNSISRRQAFAVVFQVQGEDSDVWSGLVGDSNGVLQELVFDSSPFGAPQKKAEYFVTALDCQSPEISDIGPGAVRCNHEKP